MLFFNDYCLFIGRSWLLYCLIDDDSEFMVEREYCRLIGMDVVCTFDTSSLLLIVNDGLLMICCAYNL